MAPFLIDKELVYCYSTSNTLSGDIMSVKEAKKEDRSHFEKFKDTVKALDDEAYEAVQDMTSDKYITYFAERYGLPQAIWCLSVEVLCGLLTEALELYAKGEALRRIDDIDFFKNNKLKGKRYKITQSSVVPPMYVGREVSVFSASLNDKKEPDIVFVEMINDGSIPGNNFVFMNWSILTSNNKKVRRLDLD